MEGHLATSYVLTLSPHLCRPDSECPAKGTAADAYSPHQYVTMMTGLYFQRVFFWQCVSLLLTKLRFTAI